MQDNAKVSDITYMDCAEYLRLTEVSQSDIGTLTELIRIAKGYMTSWTGRTEAELDNYRDFVICLLVLVQDRWDNRVLYVEKANLNHVVSSILDTHSVNLL